MAVAWYEVVALASVGRFDEADALTERLSRAPEVAAPFASLTCETSPPPTPSELYEASSAQPHGCDPNVHRSWSSRSWRRSREGHLVPIGVPRVARGLRVTLSIHQRAGYRSGLRLVVIAAAGEVAAQTGREVMSLTENHHIPDEPVVHNQALDDVTSDFFADLHYERLARAKDIDSYDFPRLARSKIPKVYERIEQAERDLVAPRLSKHDYDLGTATKDNDVAVFYGERPLVITAEHATAHYRPDDNWVLQRKAPDVGTAGLGYALHLSTGAHFMMMRGRQYGDANLQEEHVFKDVLAELIVERGITQVISIHGMKAGKFNDFVDERAYDVLLGIGPHPQPESVRAVERIDAIATRFDLRIATNEWFVKVADDDPLTLEVNPDGTIAFDGFHAPHYTTRACAQRVAEENGMEMAAVQVELSDLFRLLPRDMRRAKRKRHVGTYIGYRLLEQAIKT